MIRFVLISLTTVIMSIAVSGYIVYNGADSLHPQTIAIASTR
jgi:hypothetical protein